MKNYLVPAVVLSALFSFGGLAHAQSGSFLAATQAAAQNDFGEAAAYFRQTAEEEKQNVFVLSQALENHVKAGQFEDAVFVAETLNNGGVSNPLVRLVLFSDAVAQDAWADAQALMDDGPVAPGPIDGFLQAWVLLGLGDQDAGLAAFEQAGSQENMAAFGGQQRMMALAYLGQGDAALAALEDQPPQTALRSVLVQGQLLAAAGRKDEARVLVAPFGKNSQVVSFLTALEDDEFSPTAIASAQEGVADVLVSVAMAVQGGDTIQTALLYARLASFVAPRDSHATLLAARLLDRMQSFDLAVDTYDTLLPDDPGYFEAALRLTSSLWYSGREEDAVDAAKTLTRTFKKDPRTHEQYGTFLRRQEEYRPAEKAYNRAIRLVDDPVASDWRLFFYRGIVRERQDKWRRAEADFRAALELSPDQHQVLNYLGYTMVERQENLDEALDMIERAAAAQPEAGYIIDSLGWVYFRLGRYEDAVPVMENAVTLEPLDPTVNDHLGDVYWAVGRKAEARFQWVRALSLVTEDTDLRNVDLDRIKRKGEIGLDAVLEEEGADPLEAKPGD